MQVSAPIHTYECVSVFKLKVECMIVSMLAVLIYVDSNNSINKNGIKSTSSSLHACCIYCINRYNTHKHCPEKRIPRGKKTNNKINTRKKFTHKSNALQCGNKQIDNAKYEIELYSLLFFLKPYSQASLH